MEVNRKTALVGYAKRLGDGIGCLQVRNLDVLQTPALMRQLILDLGPVRGLILDLRDTYGDNFEHAVNTIPLLLNEGLIWQTQQRLTNRGKGGVAVSTISVTPKALEWSGKYPPFAEKKSEWLRQPLLVEKKTIIVVLLSENSGAAAGVIAAALKQNPQVAIMGAEVKLRTAPTSYFAVTKGKVIQLVQEGPRVDRFGEIIDPVAVCEPHRKAETNSYDAKLIDIAKDAILKALNKGRRRPPTEAEQREKRKAQLVAAHERMQLKRRAIQAGVENGTIVDFREQRKKAPPLKKIEIHDDYGVLVKL
jgi:hypothetical protein